VLAGGPGCRGVDGWRVEECQPGAFAAEPLRARLAAEGWGRVVVERHPALAGRWSVRAEAEGLRLAGVVEEGAAGCAGAKLSVATRAVPPGASARTAGGRRWRLPGAN
jgi:hypothetical protein